MTVEMRGSFLYYIWSNFVNLHNMRRIHPVIHFSNNFSMIVMAIIQILVDSFEKTRNVSGNSIYTACRYFAMFPHLFNFFEYVPIPVYA